MLEGIENPCYGSVASNAKRLVTTGLSASVSAAVETQLTDSSTNEYGYLVYLRADCTVAGTTAGYWSLLDGHLGTALINLQMATPGAIVGSSICWPFPVPWKTKQRSGVFTLTPSVGTMGTWIFVCNGFYSSL